MRFLRGCIAGALINGVFWFVYSQTGNFVSGMGVTAVVSICVIVVLRRLAKEN